jgi:putative drug exporter of the RND superfamily
MGLTERIARACAAHPGRTFAAWGLALVASIAAIALVMGELTTEAEVTNNPESVRAEDLIVSAFPRSPQQAVTDFVVVRSERYTVDDPEFGAFVTRGGREALATGAVISARTYYPTNDRSLVSADRHATMVPLVVEDDEAVADVIEVVERADEDPDFAVAITGNNTFDHDFNRLSERDLQEGELQFGVPAALIILLLVFGAVVAGLVPLLMAIFSIVVALGLVALLSQAFDLSVFIVNMLTGMGLALGIDYALFVISRYREERSGGRAPTEAIGASGATASRAVLFSGSAFVVAMFGLLLVPSTIMRSLAAGAILVGITSVLAALTLLPALLGVLRDGVNRLRIPFVGRASGGSEGRFWRAIVTRCSSAQRSARRSRPRCSSSPRCLSSAWRSAPPASAPSRRTSQPSRGSSPSSAISLLRASTRFRSSWRTRPPTRAAGSTTCGNG